MKSLLITLLIIGAAFLGYDYFLAPPRDRIIFKVPAAPQLPVAKEKPQIAETPAPVPPRPAPAPAAPPPQSGSAVAAPVATRPPRAEIVTQDKPAFVPPNFEPIEALTSNWTKFPASTFPKSVSLTKDITFKLPHGSSLLRAGTPVIALKMENGRLIIAQNEKSPVHQAVALDDTSLKSQLVQLYERWKIDRMADARRSHEETMRQSPKPEVAAAEPSVDASGKPLTGTNGKYPILMEQLRTGSPSEITPTNITHAKEPVLETIKGVPTWTIEVGFKTRTMFGEVNVASLAHVQKGKVVDWVYKGSGEIVP